LDDVRFGALSGLKAGHRAMSERCHYQTYNGPEFVQPRCETGSAAVGLKTVYIEPGSPRENGYCELFNGKFRNELLNCEIFYSLKEAQVLIEAWRRHYKRSTALIVWIPAASPADLRATVVPPRWDNSHAVVSLTLAQKAVRPGPH
jgi:putative transposase